MEVGEIYNSKSNPEYRIELKTADVIYVLSLDEARQLANEILKAITEFQSPFGVKDDRI